MGGCAEEHPLQANPKWNGAAHPGLARSAFKGTPKDLQPGLNRAKRTILWAALLLAALQARAVTPTYFWDTNGTDDGPGNPPDGVWAWNTMNWTSDPNGDSSTFANPGRVNIVFAATGGAYWTETYDYTEIG